MRVRCRERGKAGNGRKPRHALVLALSGPTSVHGGERVCACLNEYATTFAASLICTWNTWFWRAKNVILSVVRSVRTDDFGEDGNVFVRRATLVYGQALFFISGVGVTGM